MRNRIDLLGASGIAAFSSFVDVDVPDPDAFTVKVSCTQFGSIIALRAEMTPAHARPTTLRFDDYISVVLVLSGSVVIETGVGPATLGPGQALFDVGLGRRASRHDRVIDLVAVMIPLDLASARGIRLGDDAHILDRDNVGMTARALAHFLAPLASSHATVRPETKTEYIESAVLDMAAGLFAQRGRGVPSLRSQADALIANRFRDRGLSVAAVAAGLAISVRSLHRAYEGSGTSVSGEIRRMRCDYAETFLGESVGGLESISRAAGFSSGSELRRAVFARHGMTVRQYRSFLSYSVVTQ